MILKNTKVDMYGEKDGYYPNNYGLLTYKQNAMKRVISVSYPEKSDRPKEYKNHSKSRYFISIPNCLFMIHYYKNDDKLYSFCNLRLAFQDEKDKLYVPPFFNIGSNLQVCLGMSVDREKKFSSLEELCINVINSFWNTTFNFDISINYDYYILSKKPFLCDYNKWENKTKENPNWVPSARHLMKIDLNYEDLTDSFQSSLFNEDEFYLDCEDEGY